MFSLSLHQVLLAHRKPPLTSPLPENVHQVPGIQKLTPHTIILDDGQELTVDLILFCTGYQYSFPFLKDGCKIQVDDQEHITDLYKHCLNINHPSMVFIGIPKQICPFPQFDFQVRLFLAVLNGTFSLPSRGEMLADTAADEDMRKAKGMARRHWHHMGHMQWAYNDCIAQLAGIKLLPSVVQNLYDHVHSVRAVDVVQYKNKNFKTVDEENFEEIG